MVDSVEYRYRRRPAVYRSISDINPETDTRVRLIGRLTPTETGSVILDDGVSSVEIINEDNIQVIPGTVRVFAKVVALYESFELRLELVQRIDGIDIEMYRNVFLKSRS
ncbi:MAG: hypothetical protein J4473_02625 [Candidatus Aenigmarchaeota archaeon]|nr:hypothetical protein [Candidatus Aenigmarchaeota archaeon]